MLRHFKPIIVGLIQACAVPVATMAWCLLLSGPAVADSPADSLSTIKTAGELDALIATTKDAMWKQSLSEHSATILKAVALRPHVEAVMRTIQLSPGRWETINTTPESLKTAARGDVAVFQTLKLVDLAIPNAGPHDHRKLDPYDAEFFEHLGHISSLESLNIIATKLNDDWIAPLGNLTNLKTLRFTNNGKLTDDGLEKLAGLRQLEIFSFVGTGMQGHAYAKFEGWNKLTRCSHRGSSIDDEGLKQLCEHLSSLESLSLAHAKFTDAGVVHLKKLTRLKGLEIGTRNATPQCLQHLATLPLEYLQLGDGLDAPEGIAQIKDITTLRRLTLTNAKDLSEADLKVVTEMKQLEHLELGRIDLTEERQPVLKDFAFLKSMRILPTAPLTPESQTRIKQLLPAVEVTFK